MTAPWHIVTSLLLQPLAQRLIDVNSFGFRNRFILDPFRSNALLTSVLLVQIVWNVEFTRPNSRHKSALFFPILYFSYLFKFSFDAQNLPFVRDCSHIVTLQVSR